MCTQHDAGWTRLPATIVKPLPKPPRAAALINECSVTTDSVVATATVKTTGKVRRIVVQWGDGKIDTLRFVPGVDVAVVGGTPDPLPPGTFKLSHAYAGPEDRKPFDMIVIIKVEDTAGAMDFCVNPITLTPRFKVTHWRTRLNLESQCDSIFENTNEIDIRMTVENALVNAWHWEASNSIFPTPPIVLDGSIVIRELTLADPSVIVTFAVTERDPIFDDHVSFTTTLHGSQNSESISQVNEGDGCKVRFTFDRDVKLIVPLPPSGQEVVATADV